jgi:hypothetical protein
MNRRETAMNPVACTFAMIAAAQAAMMAKGKAMTSAITATGLRKSFGGKAILGHRSRAG